MKQTGRRNEKQKGKNQEEVNINGGRFAGVDGDLYYRPRWGRKSPAMTPSVSINTLYEYAGFFLNTFGGKSYLFRRSSAIPCLTDYYAVLILDRANDAGINRYGIDIRPQLDLALDNIVSRNNLLFQDQYLKKLKDLQQKYRS